MPRPGFVLEVDRSTPPMLFWRGEGFRLERLPAGRTRVVYAPRAARPRQGRRRRHPPRPAGPRRLGSAPRAAVPGHEAHHRLRRRQPAAAEDAPAGRAPAGDRGGARPGRRGRRRRRPPHRRPRPPPAHDRGRAAPRRRRSRVRRLRPERPPLQPRRRGPRQPRLPRLDAAAARRWRSTSGPPRATCSSTSTSTWSPWTAAGSRRPPAWPPTAACATTTTSPRCSSHGRSWTSTAASCTTRTGAWARSSRTPGVKVFQIETTLNTDIFPDPFDFLAKREWEWSPRDRGHVPRHDEGAEAHARAGEAEDLPVDGVAPPDDRACTAGAVDAVHQLTTERVHQQQLVPVEGQTDILTMGIPYICPYNVDSIMNPILVMCTGLGYYFNFYRGKPLVREGGVVIMTHPTYWDFHPVHHPSYIDFFEQVLADTTDPLEIEARYEKQFAEDEWYRHLYRTSYAYHGVHPFYMWYWGAHAHAARGSGHHRRRRPAGGAAPRLHPGVHHGRRAGDGHRRRRSPSDHHPPAHAAAAAGGRAVGRWPPCLVAPPACRHRSRPARPPTAPCAASAGPRSRSAGSNASVGFPYRRPTVPRGVVVPPSKPTLGADYETDWARRRPARVARSIIVNGPLRLAVRTLAAPEIRGIDRLADLRALDPPRRAPPRRAGTRRPSSSPPTTTATSTRRWPSPPSPSRGADTSSSARRPTTSSPRTSRARRRPWCSTRSPSPATSPAGRPRTWPGS